MLSFSYLPVYLWTIQLLEYQTDMQRHRFDTLGKLTPAHRAGAPIAQGQLKVPPSSGSRTMRLTHHWGAHPWAVGAPSRWAVGLSETSAER